MNIRYDPGDSIDLNSIALRSVIIPLFHESTLNRMTVHMRWFFFILFSAKELVFTSCKLLYRILSDSLWIFHKFLSILQLSVDDNIHYDEDELSELLFFSRITWIWLYQVGFRYSICEWSIILAIGRKKYSKSGFLLIF